MTHELEFDRKHAQASTSQRDHDPTPNRGSTSAQLDAPSHPMISGLLFRKARDANGVAEGADQAVAAASSSSGSSLPDTLLRKFESSLGADLSSVRVHTGTESASAASAVGAKAYTMGQDIHFGAGHYDPSSSGGQHLLAHEVAHTVQQRGEAPTRQNKLEVSAPTDHFETEADLAADAMLAGRPAAVGSAGGLARQTIMREPLPTPVIGPFAPNQSKHGVAYAVPISDYKASVVPNPPPLDQEMPSGAIGDPGPIPGWQAEIPAQTMQFGPFAPTSPAQQVVIAGADHSSDMLAAWEDYKRDLLGGVSNVWDREARAKMNTYTQQKNSDPELDKLVQDMKSNYSMANVGQKGAGTISAQAGQTNIVDGAKAPAIASDIQAKGADFTKDLNATAQLGQNGTVGGPVGQAVTALKAERLKTNGSFIMLQGLQEQLDGARGNLEVAVTALEIDDLQQKVEDETKKKEEIESGQASLKKYAPEIAGIHKLVTDNKDKLATMTTMVKAAPGAIEGDPGAILEIGKSVLEAAKWSELAKCDANIASMTDSIKVKFKLKNEAALQAARQTFHGLIGQTRGAASALMGNLLQEKLLLNKLADAVKTNWQGADKKDGDMAARALHALPIVRKVMRTLQEMKNALPKLPDAGTRASQGFTLATKGVNAPGAAELMKVGGWITGSPQAIDAELQKWTAINTQLEVVTAGLGL